MPRGIYIRTEQMNNNVSLGKMGHSTSEETRNKISKSLSGRKILPQTREALLKAITGRKHTEETKIKIGQAHYGDKSVTWKGENATYRRKHGWIRQIKGKPIKCSVCGKIEERINWANIDHKYTRDINDYVAMCFKCHNHYDVANNLKKNKKII